MQDEIKSMSEAEVLAELNTTKQRMEKLAIEVGYIGSQISAKKLALSARGLSVKKNTTDGELVTMRTKYQELSNEIRQIKTRRQKLLKAKQEYEKAKPPESRKIKPRGERPKNRVYMGSEFRDCTGYERRLALLMAYEIGQERYSELKRQASDDTRNGETDFYTGGQRSHWDDACRRPEIKVADDFERMMRTNYNQFAGEEL
jgi:chromosome segregation ATPase